MIEIRITGYTLQECIDQITGKVNIPTTTETPEIKAETTAPVKEEVKEEAPAPAPVKEEAPAKKAEAKENIPAVKSSTPSPEEVAEEAKAKTEKVKEAVEKAKEEVKETAIEISRDEAWEIANRVKNEVSLGALRIILGEFKVQKFAQLPAEDYPNFYFRCKARIENKEAK